ncbi:MAG: N-6 DNA methylase, partial [Oscillospiraceae bacterium]|nr:N-6 DNA methylase [Oscillospiraceae bacterium]
NRRLDSYEIAGRMLYEAEYNEFKSGAIGFFDRFEADKYSETQAEEIRTIIKSALENRSENIETPTQDTELTVKTEWYICDENGEPISDAFESEKEAESHMHEYPEADYVEGFDTFVDKTEGLPSDEPTKKSPVILNNEIVGMSELPPFINEEFIGEILRHDRFFKIKRDKIAEFFENTPDTTKRTEFMKKAFNHDYTELDYGDTRLGYKADESGVLMWEGNFLSRTSESVFSWDLVQSLVANLIEKGKYLDKKIAPQVYAEELQAGDKIRLDGEIWTVKNTSAYQISFVNDSGERKFLSNAITSKWYDVLNEQGFEVIPENDLSKPVFAEPEQQEFPEPEPIEAEPVPQVEQLSFFGDIEPAAPIVPSKNISKRPVVFSSTPPDDEMIDYILKCGSNEPKSLERIVAQFQKEKSAAENAEFLRKEFGTDGRGYDFVSQDKTHTTFLAAWFDSSGITAAQNITAFPQGEKIHMSWEQVSERISALLDKGEYCSQDIIDRAAELEMSDIADKLWYIHQDLSDDYNKEYFIPKEFFEGGFPNSTEKIKISMVDKDTLQKYIDGLSDFISQYEENRSIMRFHFHNLKDYLQQLKDLQIPRKEFITNADFKFEPKFFITEDEKDRLLTMGGNIAGGKYRIAKFFAEEHTAKEKADFLKNEYGIGGSGCSGYNTFHDSKGLRYKKDALTSNDCEV